MASLCPSWTRRDLHRGRRPLQDEKPSISCGVADEGVLILWAVESGC